MSHAQKALSLGSKAPSLGSKAPSLGSKSALTWVKGRQWLDDSCSLCVKTVRVSVAFCVMQIKPKGFIHNLLCQNTCTQWWGDSGNKESKDNALVFLGGGGYMCVISAFLKSHLVGGGFWVAGPTPPPSPATLWLQCHCLHSIRNKANCMSIWSWYSFHFAIIPKSLKVEQQSCLDLWYSRLTLFQ